MDEKNEETVVVNLGNLPEEVTYDAMKSAQYKKPNFLIGAKYKSSLLENQIMAMSLAEITNANYEVTQYGTLMVTMKAANIRNMTNSNKGSFYTRLNKVAASMTSKSIGYNDPEKQRFEYIAVVVRATYERGYFSIEYNPYIKQYLTDIKSNFTRIRLSVMMSFDSVYSFRLYEFLKSYAYLPKNMQSDYEDKVVKFKNRFSLSELKLTLGVINAELDSVKKVLTDSKAPNFERAVSASPEKMYMSWTDLKRNVIDVAVNEINEKSDIYVEYQTVREGHGGKVENLDISITLKNKCQKVKKELSSEEKDEIIDKVSELILQPMKIKDLRAIAEAAEYDYDKIEQAYKCAVNSISNISNFTGFMICAIKGEYYQEDTAATQSQKKKNKATSRYNIYNQFQHNEYDFEELEKELLSN